MKAVMPRPIRLGGGVSHVVEFAQQPDGTRARQFTVGGVRVQVQATGREHDEAAIALVYTLQGSADGVVRRWQALENRCSAAEQRAAAARADAAAARAELELARALVPPAVPERLLGPGCVRFRGTELWLLNKRETGWASWGVRCAGWDDLFRRYAVTITARGADEHGEFWIAIPEAP
jgi:hypothetical protein